MDKFLIAPLKSGLSNRDQAWMIADDAYYRLKNAFVFRGRLRNRFGTKYTSTDALSSRLRVFVTTTSGSGGATGFLIAPASPGPIGVLGQSFTFEVGQEFSIGSEVFRIPALGTPVTLLSSGSGVGTLDTTTGEFTFTGCALSTAIYFYTCKPVLGLTQFEGDSVHNQMAIAFDTLFAYKFSSNSWIKDGDVKLTGDNSSLVRTANWRGVFASEVILFATNAKDPIMLYQGSISSPTWSTKEWNFTDVSSPLSTANNAIKTAKAIISFKGMLLLFAPTESDNTVVTPPALPPTRTFDDRLRYSAKINPLDTDFFMEQNQPGWVGAGYVDAGTKEKFTGAYALHDVIIVTFERSVWRISYTGDQYEPFRWDRLNPELGSESPKAGISFDRNILSVGVSGIWECNGIGVERIDDEIPDETFHLRLATNGLNQVVGVRDFENEVVYWTWPTDDDPYALTYPNKLLVFNYKNGTWAFNDDTFTAFGYFEQSTGKSWLEFTDPWYTYTAPWNSNINSSQYRFVIGGNQHGFVTILSTGESKCCANLIINSITYDATSESITLTVKDHSMILNDFVKLVSVNGTTLSGIYKVTPTGNDTLVIYGIKANPFIDPVKGYRGGGLVARVPRLDVLTKEWNPYKDQNTELNLSKISFGVEKQTAGEITVDYFVSHSDVSNFQEAQVKMGTGILDLKPYTLKTIENSQRLLWHPLTFNASGDSVQLRLYWSNEQMVDPDISESGFILEALILYTQPSAVR